MARVSSSVMSDADYADRRIVCSADGVVIRGYYFPFASRKRVPYERMRGVDMVPLGPLSGRGRIWGTANLRLWANLDPSRPRKTVGFIIDVGRRVRPLVTPDDPDGFRRTLERHGVTVTQASARLV